jgi:four helix bundle protein
MKDIMEKKFDLDERLINFASGIIDISETLPKTMAGNHLGSQLLRSGTSPALHYGEAQAAESRADFIHKMKVCLKELRETFNCLRLIHKKNWVDTETLTYKIKESNELISIFVKSIVTAQQNNKAGTKLKPS